MPCFCMGLPFAAFAGHGVKTLETRSWDLLSELAGTTAGIYIADDWPRDSRLRGKMTQDALKMHAGSEAMMGTGSLSDLPVGFERGQLAAIVDVGQTREPPTPMPCRAMVWASPAMDPHALACLLASELLTFELVHAFGGWDEVARQACLSKVRYANISHSKPSPTERPPPSAPVSRPIPHQTSLRHLPRGVQEEMMLRSETGELYVTQLHNARWLAHPVQVQAACR